MQGRYIIFVDDDPDDLELITGVFKQYDPNIHVLEFKDGKEALCFLQDFSSPTFQPLLIVLDINMPRMNGKETLMALRKHAAYKNTPVVIYTTSSNKSDKEFCDKYHASWVQKPTTMEAVKQTAKILAEFCHMVS